MDEELKQILLATLKLLRDHEERLLRHSVAIAVLQRIAVGGLPESESLLQDLEDREDEALSSLQAVEALAQVDAIIDLLERGKLS